jgi:hypothetical protein
MKAIALAASLVVGICLVPAAAAAETALASVPLKGGEGGSYCSCANLSKAAIHVQLLLQGEGTAFSGCFVDIGPGAIRDCDAPAGAIWSCQVSRTDGRSASAKDLACSLATVDSAGNPTAIVPVDKKLKRTE